MARISRKKGNVNQTGTDVKDIFRTAVYLRLSVEDNGKKRRGFTGQPKRTSAFLCG